MRIRMLWVLAFAALMNFPVSARADSSETKKADEVGFLADIRRAWKICENEVRLRGGAPDKCQAHLRQLKDRAGTYEARNELFLIYIYGEDGTIMSAVSFTAPDDLSLPPMEDTMKLTTLHLGPCTPQKANWCEAFAVSTGSGKVGYGLQITDRQSGNRSNFSIVPDRIWNKAELKTRLIEHLLQDKKFLEQLRKKSP